MLKVIVQIYLGLESYANTRSKETVSNKQNYEV